MKASRLRSILATAPAGSLAYTSARAAEITPAEARAIAKDAYVFA